MESKPADENELRSIMAGLRGRLTQRRVADLMRRNSPKKARHGDGGGLYIECNGKGGCCWTYRYVINGREHWMGLGSAATFSLQEARLGALRARRVVARGLDPIEEKRREQSAQQATAKLGRTFGQVASEYYERHSAGWRSERHARLWLASVQSHARELIDVPIASVDRRAVLGVLGPIWTTRTATASRLRGRIESVIDFAVGLGYRSDGANPAKWKGGLDSLLAQPGKLAKPVHHAALDYAEAPALMGKLAAQKGIALRALEFTILTAARSGEARGARWCEVNLGKALWTVPDLRMKAGAQHEVPLAPQVIALLTALPRRAGSDLIFESDTRANREIADTTIRDALLATGATCTVHGFRATFRTWAAEKTNVPREVVEHALAHTVGSAVERAYNRSKLLDRRRELMIAWANFCARGEPENVTILREQVK
jgi:integrase